MTIIAISDEQLVASFQSGDQDAFTTLYERYDAKLQVAAKSFQRRNPHLTPEDWTSHVNEFFLEGARKYRPGVPLPFSDYIHLKISLRAYHLFRSTRYRNITDDWVRKEAERLASVERGVVSPTGPLAVMHRWILQNTIEFAQFAKLFSEGRSYHEIAKAVKRRDTSESALTWCKRMEERWERLAAPVQRQPI